MNFNEYKQRIAERDQQRKEDSYHREVQERQKQRRFLDSQNKQPGKSSFKSKAMGVGFGIGMAIDTTLNLQGGDDMGTALVKGAFTGMLYTTMPQIMFAKDLAGLASAGYAGFYKWNREQKQAWNTKFLPNFGGGYQDTRRAQTMRQAAVEAIQGSKLNARSALGGEAKILSQNFNRG